MASISSLVIPRTNSSNSLFTAPPALSFLPAFASLVLLCVLAVTLPACATRGAVHSTIDAKAYPVYIAGPLAVVNRLRLVGIFERHGFTVTTNSNSRELLICDVSLSGARTPSVAACITLRSETGFVLLQSSSQNYRQESFLGASAAAQDVTEGVLDEFAAALDRATAKSRQ